MKIRILLAVLFGSICLLQAEDKKEPEKFDPAKLVGKWQYVSSTKNGETKKAAELKDVVELTKDNFLLTGEAKFVIKYDLDAKKTPIPIKMEITESDFGKGMTAKGIIELRGEELHLCDAVEGDAPTKFESKEKSNHRYLVLKKVKAK